MLSRSIYRPKSCEEFWEQGIAGSLAVVSLEIGGSGNCSRRAGRTAAADLRGCATSTPVPGHRQLPQLGYQSPGLALSLVPPLRVSMDATFTLTVNGQKRTVTTDPQR